MKEAVCMLMPMECWFSRVRPQLSLSHKYSLDELALWRSGWTRADDYLKAHEAESSRENVFGPVVTLLCTHWLSAQEKCFIVTTSYVFDGAWWQLPDELEVLAVFAGPIPKVDGHDSPESEVFIAEYEGWWPLASNSGVTLWEMNRKLPDGVRMTGWLGLPLSSFL